MGTVVTEKKLSAEEIQLESLKLLSQLRQEVVELRSTVAEMKAAPKKQQTSRRESTKEAAVNVVGPITLKNLDLVNKITVETWKQIARLGSEYNVKNENGPKETPHDGSDRTAARNFAQGMTAHFGLEAIKAQTDKKYKVQPYRLSMVSVKGSGRGQAHLAADILNKFLTSKLSTSKTLRNKIEAELKVS